MDAGLLSVPYGFILLSTEVGHEILEFAGRPRRQCA